MENLEQKYRLTECLQSIIITIKLSFRVNTFQTNTNTKPQKNKYISFLFWLACLLDILYLDLSLTIILYFLTSIEY